MCNKELKSCSVERMSVLDSDNILYSSFIAAVDVAYSTAIYLNVTHSNEQKCLDENDCLREFSLLFKLGVGDQTEFSHYSWIANMSNADTASDTSTMQFILPQSTSGFYIAVREKKSCVRIEQIRVYYHVCQPSGNYRGPEVFARVPVPSELGEMASVAVINCTGNSSLSTSGGAVCESDGSILAALGSVCRCNDGYYRTEDGVCVGKTSKRN